MQQRLAEAVFGWRSLDAFIYTFFTFSLLLLYITFKHESISMYRYIFILKIKELCEFGYEIRSGATVCVAKANLFVLLGLSGRVSQWCVSVGHT